MKRVLVKLVVFLLLGAIVNVAVALACARWAQLDSATRFIAGDPFCWKYTSAQGLGRDQIHSDATNPRLVGLSYRDEEDVVQRKASPSTLPMENGVKKGFRDAIIFYPRPETRWGPSWSRTSSPLSEHVPVRDVPRVREDGAGWPAIALRSAITLVNVDASKGWVRSGDTFLLPQEWRTDWGVRFKTGVRSEEIEVLPLLPVWPGFAINTAFYAGILWLLFAAPFALRRRRRIRRGLCPACAYPVGDSAVCTECGKPLITHKAQKQKAEMA